MAERRRAGFRLLKAGQLSQAAIAQQLGVSPAAVSQWNKRLHQKGLRGAQAQIASGRPAKLNRTHRQTLARILKRGARAAGFPTEQWTQARIRQVIQREFGVGYHPNYISRLLNQMGWSVQKPESQPRERNEALIRAWLSKDWRRIKKSATARRRNPIGR